LDADAIADDDKSGGGSAEAAAVASELDAAADAHLSGGSLVTLVGDGNLATAVGTGHQRG
jgi:hypothetical protein